MSTSDEAITPVNTGASAPLGNTAKYGSTFGLLKFARQAVARELLPSERVRGCLRWRQFKTQDVEVWRSSEHGRAHYKKLQTCGSVWHCPVCAAKISERRRAEIQSAIAVHHAAGGDVLLLTLTNSHHKQNRLVDLLTGQAKALSRFWKDRASRELFQSFGLVGQIRAVEVTYGASGWHPHYHILLFISAPLGTEGERQFRELLAPRWLECCEAASLPLPDLEHGVDLRGGAWAARYASKWGMPEEMTRGHTKTGKRKGLTPWDMLDRAMNGNAAVARLFQEFAQAFKGKRQLHWSKGLKTRLAVADLTDQELADQVDDSAVLLGSLNAHQWQAILWAGIRGHVLQAVQDGGWQSALDLIEDTLSDWIASDAGQSFFKLGGASAFPARGTAAQKEGHRT